MIEDFAKENDLDPKYVNAVITSYFKEVKKEMGTLKWLRIKISNLGTISIRHYRVDYKIAELRRILDSIPPTSFQEIEKYKSIEDTLNKFIKLKEQYDQEKNEIRIYKEARKAQKSSFQ